VAVLTPGVLAPEYFREVAILVAAGPPDAAKMSEIMLRHGSCPAAATIGGDYPFMR
jgi:hypothetical protein